MGLWFLAAAVAGLFKAIGGAAARLATPTALVAAGILVLFFVLVHQVVYYGRPRFLVAPHYRDELGLAVIRRRAGTLRRSRLRLLLELAGWATAVVIVILLFKRT